MPSYDPSVPGAAAPPAQGWLLDRRVPVATIVSLMLQILVAGLWFGRTEARLDMLDAWVRQNQATDRRLAVIESRLDSVHDSLEKIQHRLAGDETR